MTSQYPPGWYPDVQGVTRWWDGTQWTEHTQTPAGADASGGPGGGGSRAAGSALFLAAVAAGVTAVIGSIGLWASVPSSVGPVVGLREQTGTGGGDGYIVIACVAIALVLLFVGVSRGRRWPFITALVLAALAFLLGVADFIDIGDKNYDVGWGLYVTLAGSFVLAILSVALMARRSRSP